MMATVARRSKLFVNGRALSRREIAAYEAAHRLTPCSCGWRDWHTQTCAKQAAAEAARAAARRVDVAARRRR